MFLTQKHVLPLRATFLTDFCVHISFFLVDQNLVLSDKALIMVRHLRERGPPSPPTPLSPPPIYRLFLPSKTKFCCMKLQLKLKLTLKIKPVHYSIKTANKKAKNYFRWSKSSWSNGKIVIRERLRFDSG